MPKVRKPPSQTWRTFLNNHIREMVSIDFLTVPTATFRVLYVLKEHEESAMDLVEGATKRLANELSKAGVGVTVRVPDPFSRAVRSIPVRP